MIEKAVEKNLNTKSSGLRKIVWMSATPPAKFQLTDTEWALIWKFNGYWTLDRKLSDNKEWSLAHVWQLSRLMRQAIDKLDLLVVRLIADLVEKLKTVLYSVCQSFQDMLYNVIFY